MAQVEKDEKIREVIIKMIEDDISSYEQPFTPQEMIDWVKKAKL